MTGGTAVSNTSPLIVLDRIGQVDLLTRLFDTVFLPPAVVSELGPDFTLPERIVIKAGVPTRVFTSSLGRGEVEAISLALEITPNYLIIDDSAARLVAERHGVNVVGTLGLLLAAKRRGFISEVKPLLEILSESGFRMTEDLANQVLRDAGE